MVWDLLYAVWLRFGSLTHKYLHRDHLGSVTAIIDEATGTVVDRLSYDAWGMRRVAATWAAGAVTATDHRGYTGHEHLDDIGIIHMNGRIYSPSLGRMLSPDPVTQAPENGQNYNRYTYAFNNPLKFSDPSGYCSSEFGGTCGGNNSSWRWGNSDSRSGRNPHADLGGIGNIFTPDGRVVWGGVFYALDPTTGSYMPSSSITTPPTEEVGDTGHETAEAMVQEAPKSGALNGSKVFVNESDAAREVLAVLQPIANATGVEIGGSISPIVGGFVYGEQSVGCTPKPGEPATVNIPTYEDDSAVYHTHPKGSAGSYEFSVRDVIGVSQSGRPNYRSYTDADGVTSFRVCHPNRRTCSPVGELPYFRVGDEF